MRRYIRSYRTRSNVRDPDALRDQFIRQLTEEASALLAQLSQQFATDISQQSTQVIKNFTEGNTRATLDTGAGSITSIGGLISTGVRYLVRRPRTSRNVTETSRSQNAEVSFKLSRAQQLAEAGIQLNKGEKNV